MHIQFYDPQRPHGAQVLNRDFNCNSGQVRTVFGIIPDTNTKLLGERRRFSGSVEGFGMRVSSRRSSSRLNPRPARASRYSFASRNCGYGYGFNFGRGCKIRANHRVE